MNWKLSPCPCTRKILVQYRDSIPKDMNMSWDETMKKSPTASMAPSMLKLPNPHWSRTGSNLSTYICASCVGSLFVIREKTGGLSCAKRIAARESHAAVSWRCAARHTSSKRGPAGSEIRVASEGREVIDLNRSLNAYDTMNTVSSTLDCRNKDAHCQLQRRPTTTPLRPWWLQISPPSTLLLSDHLAPA